MFDTKIKKKFRRRTFNPITSYFLLTLLVVILSGIFSLFNFQTTYNVIDSNKLEYVQVTSTIENLFSFDGLKYIVSNASKMFISFAPPVDSPIVASDTADFPAILAVSDCTFTPPIPAEFIDELKL